METDELEARCQKVADAHGAAATWDAVHRVVAPLRDHSPETYDHSLRVGWYAHNLAQAEGLDPVLALLGGFGHDVGKLDVVVDVLCAETFGDAERAAVCVHPMTGYQRLKDTHPGAAQVAGLHHTFQEDPYGIDLDEVAPLLPAEEREEVVAVAHLVSDVDFYDALTTRDNDRGLVSDPRDQEATREVLLRRMSPERVSALFTLDPTQG